MGTFIVCIYRHKKARQTDAGIASLFSRAEHPAFKNHMTQGAERPEGDGGKSTERVVCPPSGTSI